MQFTNPGTFASDQSLMVVLVLFVLVLGGIAILFGEDSPLVRRREEREARRARWRSLRVGMSDLEVRSTIGEPDRVSVEGDLAVWDYKEGRLRFAYGKLMGWDESGV